MSHEGADKTPPLAAMPPDDASRRTGVALVLFSGAAFGTMPVFARAAYVAGVNPSAALFVRFTLAALCMLLLMAARRTPFPRGRDLRTLCLLGSVVYVGQSLTYYMALGHTSAAVAVLVVYVYPALVTVGSVAFLQEHLTLRKAMAVALSLSGCALTVGPLEHANLHGVGLALLSAVIYAIYVLAGTRLVGRVGAKATTAVILTSTAATYGLLLLVNRPTFPATDAGWAALVAMALVSTVAAVLAFLAGVKRVGPVVGSTLATVEPVFAVAFAALFLRETLTAPQMAGGGLIIVAVLLIARP